MHSIDVNTCNIKLRKGYGTVKWCTNYWRVANPNISAVSKGVKIYVMNRSKVEKTHMHHWS